MSRAKDMDEILERLKQLGNDIDELNSGVNQLSRVAKKAESSMEDTRLLVEAVRNAMNSGGE